MTDVYDKMDSIFSGISAYHISTPNDPAVGRILFKHSKAGVVTCFVQEWGFKATMGKAGGYGYDKQGASIHDAIHKALADDPEHYENSGLISALKSATYDGQWQNMLREAGYIVQHVI